jgi:C4-dicarboxylate-specific signal transduction histidine kinase
VRDNGPGVPPGLDRQIFLPFFSAREGGQGIGPTVVRQLVNGMGGRVRHVRPIEGGAAFVLSFQHPSVVIRREVAGSTPARAVCSGPVATS